MERSRTVALPMREDSFAGTAELALRASLRRNQRIATNVIKSEVEMVAVSDQPLENIILGEE